ncbi:MAG: Asp-tRNA(Asn)/Glu-tRNA(Gln) amidotransferase subunit GatA [Armatimonadetes bacterium]|nr:Asp-tRNA(Asn)/Glu-tRNA(Gln) amidotransferase subunit GatA [Armatimonadota bacterium]
MELWELSAAEMRRRLDSRDIFAGELAEAHLDRIRAVDPKINAFITVTEERATSDAAAAQKRIDQGSASALTGIPVALKDNMVTLGIKTTCASRMLENYVPPYSGTVEQRIAATGAVLLGKTNMDEFAMGTSTEFSAFFPSRNPYDLERVPGGSSGGSAAAVAANMTPISFGSDTGGSVRQPASLCGVVGFKPTYGRVSRYGLVAFSSSLDQIGPFARTVQDAMDAFEATMGPDGMDSTCVDAPYAAAAARRPSMKGRRLGVPKELLSDEVSAPVRECVEQAIEKLTAEGAEIEEFSASMIEHGVSTYYIIAPAEASSNLARFDGVRYGLRVPDGSHVDMMKATRARFGREVKERIIIGTHVLSSGYYEAYYAKAHQARTLMKSQFQEAFQKFDAIVSPTSPTTAFKIGELTGDPIMLKLLDYCTIPANIGGFPAISLNSGYFEGLPIGIQFVCDSFDEEGLFSLALAAEAILDSPKASLAV